MTCGDGAAGEANGDGWWVCESRDDQNVFRRICLLLASYELVVDIHSDTSDNADSITTHIQRCRVTAHGSGAAHGVIIAVAAHAAPELHVV